MRAALLLLPAFALASCGGAATGNTAGATNAAVENASVATETKGWRDLFDTPPAQVLAMFEKLSFKPGAYEEMGGMMMSHGAPIALADAMGDKRNTLTLNASGDTARLSGVSFDIALPDAATADAARERAATSITTALRIAGLDGEAVVKAALARDAKPMTGKVDGANYAVVRKDDRTTINFTKQSI